MLIKNVHHHFFSDILFQNVADLLHSYFILALKESKKIKQECHTSIYHFKPLQSSGHCVWVV